jgi:hypothetical protein
MTPHELDEIIETKWPAVVRRAMADGSDEWIKGFVRSIAKQAKRANWKPTQRQASLMRRLVADLTLSNQDMAELVER